jgi:hypothetical protein
MSSTDNLDARLCGSQSNWSDYLEDWLTAADRDGFQVHLGKYPTCRCCSLRCPVHRCGRPGGGEPPRRSHQQSLNKLFQHWRTNSV